MKRYSTFPKAATLMKLHQQIVLCHIRGTLGGGFLPLGRDAVGVSLAPADWVIECFYKNVFSLVSLYNDMSTFVGYLKSSL